ncbi:MAG TPA: hypothetical protein VFG69_00250, partial [Nannocystaceae bacterium]|nr:hypothetical protein [Nannocystaceae bacterium]
MPPPIAQIFGESGVETGLGPASTDDDGMRTREQSKADASRAVREGCVSGRVGRLNRSAVSADGEREGKNETMNHLTRILLVDADAAHNARLVADAAADGIEIVAC